MSRVSKSDSVFILTIVVMSKKDQMSSGSIIHKLCSSYVPESTSSWKNCQFKQELVP